MKLHGRHAVIFIFFFTQESVWIGFSFLSFQEILCESMSPWSAFPVREVFLSIGLSFSYTVLQFSLLYNLK